LESAFDRYEPVCGPASTRPRTDDNPLNRDEYLRRVIRHVSGPLRDDRGERIRLP
jgi:ribosomal protection tetracycline resistance protein